MAGFDNAYSRVVAVAKIVLPLIALGLMSTLFLIARPTNQQVEPGPFADLTVLDLAREQRLGAPTYTGVTAQGTRVTLAAESLRPDPQRENVILGDALAARLLTPEGLAYDISAPRGEIDRAERQTTFAGMVQITTSNGYDLKTDEIVMQSDLSRIVSPTPITITGPIGQLSAAHMLVTRDPETGDDARVVFTGGVHLLYIP